MSKRFRLAAFLGALSALALVALPLAPDGAQAATKKSAAMKKAPMKGGAMKGAPAKGSGKGGGDPLNAAAGKKM